MLNRSPYMRPQPGAESLLAFGQKISAAGFAPAAQSAERSRPAEFSPSPARC